MWIMATLPPLGDNQKRCGLWQSLLRATPKKGESTPFRGETSPNGDPPPPPPDVGRTAQAPKWPKSGVAVSYPHFWGGYPHNGVQKQGRGGGDHIEGPCFSADRQLAGNSHHSYANVSLERLAYDIDINGVGINGVGY